MIAIPKNYHAGQRCFVIASGPSIKQTDLFALQTGVTICVNQSYEALDYDPDYICIGDRVLWPNIKDRYVSMSSRIVAGTGTKGTCGSDYAGDNMVALLTLDMTRTIRKHGLPRDLENEPLVKGYNVVPEVVLPFVVWAGFAECYLVGCDCTDNGYFYDKPLRDVSQQKVLPEAMLAYRYIAGLDLSTRIFNATVGGQLEAFPRVDIRSL